MDATRPAVTMQPLPTNTQTLAPADSSNCFSRALSVVVDCLCWIWEKVKLFLALITCNLCFGPAEATSNNGNTTPPTFPNLQNCEIPNPRPADYAKQRLISHILHCDNLQSNYIIKMGSAVDKLFLFIAPSEIKGVVFADGGERNYIRITTTHADAGLAERLRALPGMQNQVWTYKDHPSSTERSLIQDTVICHKNTILIPLYNNDQRQPTTAWVDAMMQWQPQSAPSTATSATSTRPTPPTLDPNALESTKQQLIATLKTRFCSNDGQGISKELVESSINQLFRWLLLFKVNTVTPAGEGISYYIKITTPEASRLETCLRAQRDLRPFVTTTAQVENTVFIEIYSNTNRQHTQAWPALKSL